MTSDKNESQESENVLPGPFNAANDLTPTTEALVSQFAETIDQVGETGDSENFAKPVKVLPKHGVFFRWPAEGIESFVHPDDVELALKIIPGSRIFELDQCQDQSDHEAGYSVLSYGDLSIRIQPAMWLRVAEEGYRVGDRVEVLSNNGQKRPVIGNLIAVTYNPVARKIEYKIEVNGMALPKKFHKDDFRPCRRLGVPLNKRENKLLNRASISF